MHRHALLTDSGDVRNHTGGTRAAPRGRDAPPALLRLRHDLRQPLAAISWSVDAVTDTDDLPVHLSTALDQIGQQARWMERLLAEMLDDAAAVSVVDLGEALAASCSVTPVGAPYQVAFAATGDVPVLVDPVELERAARNLMDNAARAVADGGRIEVEVSARGDRGVLEVADSGPGFGALPTQHGHGLVGVRRFAERYGGELVCGTSSLGGALVALSLPRAPGR